MWKKVQHTALRPGTIRRCWGWSYESNPVLTQERRSTEFTPRAVTIAPARRLLLSRGRVGADEVLVDLQQTTDTTGELLDIAQELIKSCYEPVEAAAGTDGRFPRIRTESSYLYTPSSSL